MPYLIYLTRTLVEVRKLAVVGKHSKNKGERKKKRRKPDKSRRQLVLCPYVESRPNTGKQIPLCLRPLLGSCQASVMLDTIFDSATRRRGDEIISQQVTTETMHLRVLK